MEILTATEALKLLKVCRTTLYLLVKEGKVRTHRIGAKKLFIKDELIEDLKNL